MDSRCYAAAGLAAQTQALELVAHNLANLSTTGYGGQQTTFRSLLTGDGAVCTNPLNVAVNNFGVLAAAVSTWPRTASRLPEIPWMGPLEAADFFPCSPGRTFSIPATAARTLRRRDSW